MDTLERLIEQGSEHAYFFLHPNGDLVMVDNSRTIEAFNVKLVELRNDGYDVVGTCALIGGEPEIAFCRDIAPAVAFVIGATYKRYVEALSTPASDYDFSARRYH